MLKLAGIVGYFARDKENFDEKGITDKINMAMLEEYEIAEFICGNSCILEGVDIKSARSEQPTKKEDKINLIVCGEIYNENIENLDKSILAFYEEGRLDKLKDFNGSFAAAIYDKTEEKLTLVNDRYGLIKLFYYHDKDRFCFAPKIRPLLRLGANKSLRKDAIIDFFLFGYLLGDKTFFEHIHQLPPASILEVSKNDMNLTKYWDYEYDGEYDARPKEELIEELGALWQRAVERRSKKDETIIIPLSGGLDSRAVLAATLRCTSKDNIITFTFGEQGSFDFEIGKMVAEKAGVRNIPLRVEKADFERKYTTSLTDVEGMIDVTPYFPIEGYKYMKKYGSKLRTGYMGGELMGPLIFSKVLNKKLKSEENYIEAKNMIFEHHRLNNLEDIQRLLNPAYLNTENLRSSFEDTLEDITQISDKDLPNYCATWLYKHENDKCTSFFVFRNKNLFEILIPFLDNELIDFMLKIPPELRVNKNLYKSMLLKKYPDLFELPTKTNLGLRLDAGNISLFLRRDILFLKRRSNKISSMLIKRNIFLDKDKNYIDYDDLLRRDKEYRNYMRRMIEKVKEREYFNRDYIEEIWRLHMQGKKNYSMLFGLLVTFELFLEGFVDEVL